MKERFHLRYLWHNETPANLDIIEKYSQAFSVTYLRRDPICLWSVTVQRNVCVCMLFTVSI